MRWIGGMMVAALALTALARAESWSHYTDPALNYTISYPSDWTLEPHYVNTAMGPDHAIMGFAFTAPARFTHGTNLGSDTALSVESLPGRHCRPSQFVDPAENVERLRIDGRTYTKATSSDAGAGNRYETTIYVLDGAHPCIAIRAFIHYSAIENFDPGTVKAFDRDRLTRDFDRMRDSLRPAR